MFCPRCATENAEQSYCRQCGLALMDVQLAIHGTAMESLSKLKSGSHLMNGGIATLVVFNVIALIIIVLSLALNDLSLITIAMINAMLGALVGLPLVIIGKSRVTQGTRLLSGRGPIRELDSRRETRSVPSSELEANRLPPP